MSYHRIEIVSGFMSDGWTALCSCGWEGVEQDSSLSAMFDGDSHVKVEASTERPAGDVAS